MSSRRESFPKEVARYAIALIEDLNTLGDDTRFDGAYTGPIDLYYQGDKFPARIEYSTELEEYCLMPHEE